MRKPGVAICYAIIGLLLYACGGSSNSHNNQLQEDLLALEQAMNNPVQLNWDELSKDTLTEGTFFEIEGYIGFIGSKILRSDDYINVPLYERRNQFTGVWMGLDIHVGDMPTMINELPKTFELSDVRIVCDDGRVARIGDRILVKAEKNGLQDDWQSVLISNIDLVDADFDTSVFEKAIPLTNELIKYPSDQVVYCYMEGKIGTRVTGLHSEIYFGFPFVSLSGLNLNQVVVKTGNSASCVSGIEAGSHLGSKPKIRDYKGELISEGVPVRLYGTWYKNSGGGDRTPIFYVEEIVVLK